ALVGWELDLPSLKSLLPGRVAMNPATALCFVLAGGSLWLQRSEADRRSTWSIARMCAAVVAGVGLLKLNAVMGGFDLGVDQLLFREQLAGWREAKRKGPTTALY